MNQKVVTALLLSLALCSGLCGCASPSSVASRNGGRPAWVDKATKIRTGMPRAEAVTFLPQGAHVSHLTAGGRRTERYDLAGGWTVTLEFDCPNFQYDPKPDDKVVKWEIKQGNAIIEQGVRTALSAAGCAHLTASATAFDTADIKTISYRTAGASAEIITWRNESIITVTVGDRIVFREAYLSNTGHNGQYIMDAAWSPNGNYLAFKHASSGGHMPYRSPVKILRVIDGKAELLDAETIIRRIPSISNIAVSHYAKPWLEWRSDTQLQVNVMSHDKPNDSGFYIIDLDTLTARRPPPTPPGEVLKAAPESEAGDRH